MGYVATVVHVLVPHVSICLASVNVLVKTIVVAARMGGVKFLYTYIDIW